MLSHRLALIGYASGIAGVDSNVGKGPLVLQSSPFLLASKDKLQFHWDAIIYPPVVASSNVSDLVSKSCEELAKKVSELIRKQQCFTVIGGDHSCAIGTWSGVYDALKDKGDVGLIWIDAHMDSHTPTTSETGRIHGMPLACLLGHGYAALTHILHPAPKLKPQHVCLIGVRSFEQGEEELLKQLNVRIYFMDEVIERGFATVLKEAVNLVSANTVGYGLSIDLDGFDPLEVPGVDVPELDGIHVNDFLNGISEIAIDPKLIATEIVEFDPSRDKNQMTEKVIVSLLEVIHSSKIKSRTKYD